MTREAYPGPQKVGGRGRGMGSWIWVAPGLAPPPSDQRVGLGATAHDAPGEPEGAALDVAAEATATETDAVEPPDADLTEPARIRIKVLGSVEVDPELEAPKRNVVIELACYLALHRRRPATTNELQMALSGTDDGHETSAKSVRTYMSELRRWLGAEHVPSARGSGYRVAESVSIDWDEFRSLAREREGSPFEQIGPLAEALNLVRGRPFAGTNYKWVDAELLVSEMEVAISDVARRLATLAPAEGGDAMRWFAGRRAALACPYDVGLWEMALEGAAGYDRAELERTWRDAQVALGDEASTLRDAAQRLGLT